VGQTIRFVSSAHRSRAGQATKNDGLPHRFHQSIPYFRSTT
jgi:hypothetical protein